MPLLLPEVKDLLKEKDFDSLKSLLSELHPVDILELIDTLPQNYKLLLFNLLELKKGCEVIARMEPSEACSFLELLPQSKVIQILNEMPPDERADIFATLPQEKALHLLSLMDKSEVKDVKKLVAYPPESAGGIMTTQFAWIPAGISVGEAIEALRQEGNDFDFYQVYVLSEGKLLGVISLRDLIISPPNTKVNKIMKKIPSVSVSMDQEKVAQIIAKYDLPSIPVVDENKVMHGIITVDDVIDVIHQEATEDMHKFSGITLPYRSYFDIGVRSAVKSRLPWLVILLFAAFISGFIIETFSELLKKIISLAVFIPALLDCCGNAGTQSATIVVRGLATGEIKFNEIWKIIRKEILIGILLGIGLGIIIALRSLPVGKSIVFGATVGISMVAGIIIATIIGTVLPIILAKMRFDPALMSGPLVTTIMDTTSLLIYFTIAFNIM